MAGSMQSRRGFITGAVVAVGGAALWSKDRFFGGGTATDAPAVLPVTENPTPFITPVKDFFRIDTALGGPPQVDSATWTLQVKGMVDSPVTLTLTDLAKMPQVEHVITLGCVSNEVGDDLIGTARWSGVLLADVLRRAGVQPGAEQLVSTSADGWTCGTPVSAVMDGRPAMLVTHMNGAPLTIEHGFPVRMVVPGLFGYVSATKWLTTLELTTWDAFDAYWVQRGWAKEGPMIASSRIDYPRNGARVPAGRSVIGGSAWAPRSGVRQVEVQVDDGPWASMNLVPGGTGDAWVQWKGEWSADPGVHTLRVRVTNNEGTLQDARVRPVEPSGATGLHSIRVEVA